MKHQRAASVAAACGLCLLLSAPYADAQACSPPSLGTAASKRALRASPVIALGTIGETAPRDAHGLFSFLLVVERYVRGAGPARAEFTVYEGEQAPLSALQPGSSIDASRGVADRYGGQRGLVAASPETEPFSGQFAVDRCVAYAFYGDAAVARALPLVERLLTGAPPPKMPRTGGPPAPGLLLGVGAVLCGVLLRRGGRRLLVAASHDFLAGVASTRRPGIRRRASGP
jgi:hypothetical protein